MAQAGQQPPVTARMIAVHISWQQRRAPLLIRATSDLAETLAAVREATNDDEPFHLLTTVEGLEVEPSAGVWPMLLQDAALPVFSAVSDCPGGAEPPRADTMVVPPMSDTSGLGFYVLIRSPQGDFPLGTTRSREPS